MVIATNLPAISRIGCQSMGFLIADCRFELCVYLIAHLSTKLRASTKYKGQTTDSSSISGHSGFPLHAAINSDLIKGRYGNSLRPWIARCKQMKLRNFIG